MNQLTQTNHDLLFVGSEIEKFNENRILGSFGIVKKDLNDKYNKNIFDSYKKNSGVYTWLKVQDGKKVVDAGLVRTYSTLKKLDEEFKKENCTMLLHPYAVRIPEGFWSKWKQANTPQERINLLKEYNLIKDESIYKIDKIVLDIDTPIEYALDVLQRTILPGLRIYEGYEIGKTKSGNTRVILYLKWPLKANDVFRKQKHLERLRELYYLLIEIFHAYNLKLDRTFADRINHPIWFSFNSHFYQRAEKIPGKIPFYTLYGLVKKVQKKMKYWVTKDKQNLTMRFWGDRRPKRKSVKIELPAFLRNELKQYFDDDYKLTLWKKAVKSLYKGKGGRFINFILPTIGWAKYLNLNRVDVDTYLMQFLADRDINKTEKDLDIAWKHANELEFRLPDNGRQIRLPANLDLIQITEKALNLVKQTSKTRQELLQEIFYKQAWLCDLVMNFLEKKGLVKSEFVKSGRRGRPSKVYHYTDNNKKENQTKNSNDNRNNNVTVQRNENKNVNRSSNTNNIGINNKSANDTIKTINSSKIETNNKVMKSVNNNDSFEDIVITNTMTKKTFEYESLTEYLQNYRNSSGSVNVKDCFYVYEPETKQYILVSPRELLFYEHDRLAEIKFVFRVLPEGYRIPTIRSVFNDSIFTTLFAGFKFTKQCKITNDAIYILGPINLGEYYYEKFRITGDMKYYEYLLKIKLRLNFTPYTHMQFRFVAGDMYIIEFHKDLDTLKVWVNPEEFNKFYFGLKNAKTYLEKLANGFYKDNPKIKTYTIKDRRYYSKTRAISQKEQLNGTNYLQLFKDRNYWYMQARQINYHDAVSEYDKNKIFPYLKMEQTKDHQENFYNNYRFTLSKTENITHFTLKNNQLWMPR